MANVEQVLRDTGVIPVIKLEDEQKAVSLGRALLEGGIPAAEVTFRTPAAAKSIENIAKALPEMFVCAGTVLSVEQAKLAVDCGAKAVISPGTNRDVVEWCVKNNVPVYPGCATPSEVEAAMGMGLTTVKLFPAEVVGGVKMLQALYGPYRGVKFMPTGGISADKARSIALTDAGISESDALGLRVKQDWDDGVALYEVEFRSGGAEYEYDIRLSDGAILKSERDADNNYTYFAASSGSGALIGEAAAKTAALQHAGVSESQTSYLSCQLEYDDGRLECYEVEFRSGSTEYEYEIGPYDGAIWKAERETHGSAAAAGASAAISGNTAGGNSSAGTASGNTSSSVSSFISAEAAKAAALSHAGVSTAQVREMECKLDEDDGIDVYEIEFKSAQMEYEYEIDAYTGAILKAEQDWD